MSFQLVFPALFYLTIGTFIDLIIWTSSSQFGSLRSQYGHSHRLVRQRIHSLLRICVVLKSTSHSWIYLVMRRVIALLLVYIWWLGNFFANDHLLDHRLESTSLSACRFVPSPTSRHLHLRLQPARLRCRFWLQITGLRRSGSIFCGAPFVRFAQISAPQRHRIWI